MRQNDRRNFAQVRCALFSGARGRGAGRVRWLGGMTDATAGSARRKSRRRPRSSSRAPSVSHRNRFGASSIIPSQSDAHRQIAIQLLSGVFASPSHAETGARVPWGLPAWRIVVYGASLAPPSGSSDAGA
jgi:hypothetical protein